MRPLENGEIDRVVLFYDSLLLASGRVTSETEITVIGVAGQVSVLVIHIRPGVAAKTRKDGKAGRVSVTIPTITPRIPVFTGEDWEYDVVRRKKGGAPLDRLVAFGAHRTNPKRNVSRALRREIIFLMTIDALAHADIFIG